MSAYAGHSMGEKCADLCHCSKTLIIEFLCNDTDEWFPKAMETVFLSQDFTQRVHSNYVMNTASENFGLKTDPYHWFKIIAYLQVGQQLRRMDASP